jgi:hypothetical protein
MLLGTYVHYTGALSSAPVHPSGTHACAPTQFTGALQSAPVQDTTVHTCATVQPTGAHIVCTLVPLTGAPMRAYPVGRRALVRAYFQIACARGGPHS